jgi:hypothetical protein
MNFDKIAAYFEKNIVKKTLSELSLDKENNSSLVNSNSKHFDFDEINKRIKTTDTIVFKNSRIIFVEFKKGGTIKDRDFRLKASESIISLINLLIENNVVEKICFPTDLFRLYFVYDRNNISSTQVVNFGNIERKLTSEYKNLFSKYSIIPQDRFKKVFDF